MKEALKSFKWRTKFIIYPQFQIPLLILDVAIISSFFLACLFSVNRSYAYLKNEGVKIGLTSGHSYFDFLNQQANLVYHSIFISFVICLLVSLLFTVIISQRLAGPIVRLRQFFGEIAKGENSDITLSFRKGDFFPDLPEMINRALQKLRK